MKSSRPTPYLILGVAMIIILLVMGILATKPAERDLGESIIYDKGIIRLAPPPPYIVAQASSDKAEVPPLPLDNIRLMAWYVAGGEIDLSRAAAAFEKYEWHDSYIEGVIYMSYSSAWSTWTLGVYARVRSDGVIIVWLPKGWVLTNVFFENKILFVEAIAKILKASGISPEYNIILKQTKFYSPEHPEANTIVIIYSAGYGKGGFSYIIPHNVKPIAAYLGLTSWDEDYVSVSIDGAPFEYRTPGRLAYYELNLTKFYPKWSEVNTKHTVVLKDYYEFAVMVIFLRVEG